MMPAEVHRDADLERLANRCRNRATALRIEAERLRQVVFSLDQAADQWEAEADVQHAKAQQSDGTEDTR